MESASAFVKLIFELRVWSSRGIKELRVDGRDKEFPIWGRFRTTFLETKQAFIVGHYCDWMNNYKFNKEHGSFLA